MGSTNALTHEQRIAVEVFDAPIAMMAGAGSGKTRVLVERFLSLVQRGVSPSRILAVTFTNEAAEELRARILHRLKAIETSDKTLEAVENSAWIGTIHSFCYRIFEQYGSFLKRPPLKTITDDFELVSLFAKEYEQWTHHLTDKSLQGLLTYFNSNDLYEMAETIFLNHFHFNQSLSIIKNREDLGNRMVLRLAELLLPLVNKVRAHLHEQGSYTFNDLETFAQAVLLEHPAAALKVQNQFDALLIDEFQDTTRLQWAILKAVLGESAHRLFIVGDPKQSIYGFRHADVSLFREVNQWVESMGGHIQTLSLNFRTQKTLLNAINTTSEQLFELSNVPFQEMKAGLETSGVGIRLLEYPVTEDGTRSQAQDIEQQKIIELVIEKHKAGAKPEEIAIFFRNSDKMKDYSEALRAQGLETYIHLTHSLFESYDLLDLISFLECFADPLSDYWLSSLLFSSFVTIPVEEFSPLSEKKKQEGITLFECLAKTPNPRYDWFVQLIESGKTDTPTVLETLFSKTRVFPQFHEGFLTLLGPLLKCESIQELLQNLKVWKKRGVLVSRVIGSKDKGVRLMTVHASKGLEFPHVFLADSLRQPPKRQPSLLIAPNHPTAIKFRTEEGFGYSETYETLWSYLKGQEEEEAKRILYVAMTRAMETLTVFLPTGMKSLPKGSWAALLAETLQKEGTKIRNPARLRAGFLETTSKLSPN